ncbi:hypothetical protein [Amycolatopsis rubida]|uniref:hypothetical protein n=1 Tax=Amycolatopsis rubida TaxID=112413 RepID=UPI001160439A|nr:hypothetical protein [Amycolatopsis rubida]
MALSPRGAWFLVEAGTPLHHELDEAAGVELVPPDTLVALPPSRAIWGALSWRIPPDDLDSLGDSGKIQTTLAELLAVRREGSTCRGLAARTPRARAGSRCCPAVL